MSHPKDVHKDVLEKMHMKLEYLIFCIQSFNLLVENELDHQENKDELQKDYLQIVNDLCDENKKVAKSNKLNKKLVSQYLEVLKKEHVITKEIQKMQPQD